MVRYLPMLAALLLLTGCARFDVAKAREGCRKAHGNDEVAAEKCIEAAVARWESALAWVPRLTHRRPETPE